MNRTCIVSALAALLAFPQPLRGQAISGPDVWQRFAAQIDPGTTLKVRLKDGQRFTATLLQSSPDAVILQPKTRAAVPPHRVAFDRIERLEIDRSQGIGIGKAVAIGAGVGAGVWLALMAMAFAVWGD